MVSITETRCKKNPADWNKVWHQPHVWKHQRFYYWHCPPAWWRDWWSSSCTTSYVAVAAEGGSPGRCVRSTLSVWHHCRPWWAWHQRVRRWSPVMASHLQGRDLCHCVAETSPAAKRHKMQTCINKNKKSESGRGGQQRAFEWHSMSTGSLQLY